MTNSNRDREFPGGSSPRDRGTTFVELLVSVVLIGTVGIAVLTATAAALRGARVSDQIAKSQAVLAEAADYLTDTDGDPVLYVDCDGGTPAADYQAALDTKFGAGAIQVVTVEYWDRTLGADGDFGTACNFVSGDRLQRIELLTTINDSDRTLQVVKRPITVPTVDTVPADPLPPYTGGSGQATVSLTPGING